MGKAMDNHNPGQDMPIDTVRLQHDELVRSIRFLGDVSVKIHGLRDENEIYKTILDEFGKSGHYSISILLLTDDKTHLRLVGASLTSEILKAAEKASGLRYKGFLIDLSKSNTYNQVVRHGKIVHTSTIDIMKEILPKGLTKLVPLLTKILGHEKKASVLLPIYINDSIVGAVGVTPPELFEDFVPSAENFSRQISTALELAHQATESKRAKEALRENEEKIRAILDASPDVIHLLDINGIILSSNDGFAKRLGLEIDDVVGKCVFDYTSNKSIPGRKAAIDKVFRTGEPLQLEDDGLSGVFESHVHPVFNPAGEVTAVAVYARDITERKQAERALREKDFIIRSASSVIATAGMDGNMTYVNPAFLRAWGFDNPDEVIGRPFPEFWMVSDKRDEIMAALTGREKKWKGETLAKRKDGSVFNVIVSAATVLDDKGAPVALMSTSVDITEQKLAEEALLEASKFRENILSEAPVGISIYDAVSGQCLAGNKAIAELVGASEEQVLAQNFYTIESWKNSGLLETAKSALKDNSKKELEVSVTTTFGKEISFYCYFVPFQAGEKRYLLFTLNDLTERKQMENQLRQSEKMQAIGQLAGGIAHDFNNQLGSILGYADMVREEVGDNPTLARYVDNILISVRRSADLTAQLLAFSRQGKYQDIIVDIHNVIHEVVSMLQHSIDKRIVIKQHLNANPPATTGDPTQLQNAILNLALNARDAMPRGGDLIFSTDVVQVDKSYKKNSAFKVTEGSYIQICVTDTGTGMDKKTQKHAFEPFYTTKEQGKGTGMGLAAVYGTVKNHNGFVNIYSEPGKGSTFKVYLPLAESETSHSEVKGISAPAKTGAGHILLVEDDEMLRDAATAMIEALGYEVTVCADGKDAVTFYKKSWEKVDLVLLDMVMPVMDGRDTFIAMRKINPEIVALLSSGYSLNGEAKSILEEGVKGFIQKPYRKSELAEKIAELFGK